MEALLELLKSCEEGTTAGQVRSVVCPENSKAGLKTMEVEVITFEESSYNVEATNLEANPGATEAAVERHYPENK
jgi:hypothetical protein